MLIIAAACSKHEKIGNLGDPGLWRILHIVEDLEN
jgi:hypothetical protein